MTTPTALIRRNLTFHFQRSVVVTDGQQIVRSMDVAVTPLATPSSPSNQSTLVGGVQEQTVLLNQTDNTVVFQLVPTNAPGLTEPVPYRVAWRSGGQVGSTTVQDFSMPDQDCDWDQLADLGSLISGEAYLQQSDLGKPSRVAMLNAQGQVIDSSGNPVSMPADVTAVSGAISVEAVARQQGDAQVTSQLTTTINTQAGLTASTAKNYTDQQVAIIDASLGSETGARQNAINTLSASLSGLQSSQGGQITTLQGQVSTLNTEVAAKADKVGGFVPIAQIPPGAITNWFPVASTSAMTALTYPTQVQVGDVALTPTAAYVLLTTDPSQLGNWRLLNDIISVNGYTGVVNLTAADVGAVAADNGQVDIEQVNGLQTALSALASAAALATLATQVTNLAGDSTIVHTTSGVIQDAVLPANIALISPQNNITNKSGTVIAIGEGSGVASVNGQTGVVVLTAAQVGALASNGTVTESQVTGLTADLAARVLSTDTRLTNARTPTAHAASHQLSGSDALALDPTQVTGLTSSLTSATNGISSLDTRVTSLEAHGPGGYGAGTGVYFAATAPTGDFVTNVTLHSPFGYNPTNAHANGAGYYMDPAGALASDVVYPNFTVAGALAFNKWGTPNTPDPYYAAATALTSVSNQVGAKAAQTDLTALTNTVSTLATQSSVNTLVNTVAAKANTTDLQSLTTTVNGKANSTDLATTNATVATKANASDLTTANTNISTLTAALPTKADLVGGVLKSTQIPTGINIANIANLAGYLTHLSTTGAFDAASLTNITNLTGLTIAQITGLTAALTAKADLVSGKLNPAQLPSLALTDVFSVTSTTAMTQQSTAHQGDICVVTQGAGIGTYILSSSDYTQLSNWVQLQFPTSQVSSVNGLTGTVVLGASDVGALAANASLAISQISGLQAQLNSFATTSALTAAVATLTTPVQVQAQLAASTQIKQTANYVATSAIPSLSGQQSIDGVLVPIGSVVLATAQASSVNNGLWVVNSGAWTRTTDYTTGAWLVRGSIVVVSQGTNNAKTMWQETASSGIIDTAGSSWVNIGNVAAPLTYANGNGLNLIGQQFAVKPVTGGGITATSSGVAVDPAVVARVASGAIVPSGSQVIFTLTHNLNISRPPWVVIEDTTNGMIVALGVQVLNANQVSIEFGNPPASGQYVYTIIG